jgi:hypothetical protein
MGFPAGASSIPGAQGGEFDWEAMSATGNSFSVPIIAHIMRPVISAVGQYKPFAVLPGCPTVLTETAALESLTPTGN